MKGNKLITLSIITSSILLISGCNEDNNQDYFDSSTSSTTSTSSTSSTNNLTCEVSEGNFISLTNDILNLYISGDMNCLNLDSISNTTNEISNDYLISWFDNDTIASVPVKIDKTIAPILLKGNIFFDTNSILTRVFNSDGTIKEEVEGVIENSIWESQTSQLEDGDYSFVTVSIDSKGIEKTLSKSNYSITYSKVYVGDIEYSNSIGSEILIQEESIDTNSTFSLVKNTDNNLFNFSGLSSEDITSIQLEIYNINDLSTPLFTLNPTITNTSYLSDSVDLVDGYYLIKSLLTKETGTIEVSEEFSIQTLNLYVSMDNIGDKTQNDFIISGLSDRDSIVKVITTNTDTNGVLEFTTTKDLDNVYQWNSNISLLDGNYSFVTEITDDKGNSSLSNTQYVIIKKSSSVTCLGEEIGSIVTSQGKDYMVVDDDSIYDAVNDGITPRGSDTTYTAENICVSNVIELNWLFEDMSDFNEDISTWDVSNVTNMYGMFYGASSFNQDISNWDVSNVESMAGMFYNTSSFNQDISTWDVSSVTDMEYMFGENETFNGNISLWDVSNVTNMYGMFYKSYFNGNISSWDVSNVTDMEGMFYDASSFNQDISFWNVSNVTNMTEMFGENNTFNQDLSNWDVSNVGCNFEDYDYETSSWEDINKPNFDTSCSNED